MGLRGAVDVFSDTVEVFDDVIQCHLERLILDVRAWCEYSPQSCTVKSLADNISNNLFSMLSQID